MWAWTSGTTGLEELALGLLQGAVLLLDAEHPPGAVQHHEVDLAVAGVAAVLAGPVHAVKDGVVLGQGVAQIGQGGDLGPVGPGEGEPGEVGGDDPGHRRAAVAKRVRR